MIKFTAETKCSGVDLQDGTQIRKGAFDSIRRIAESAGNKFPKETILYRVMTTKPEEVSS